MKKNKRLLALLITILIVIISLIFILPQAKLLTMGEIKVVYYPKNKIEKSTEITKDMIVQKEIPSIYATGDILNEDLIVGKIAKSDIYITDYITSEKLANEDEKAIYENSNLISISVKDISSSVSGYIRIGDKVNIYAKDVNKDLIEGEAISIPKINNLEIAALVDGSGLNVVFNGNNPSSVIASVVLKVPDEKTANSLIKMESIGGLHLERVKE